MASTAPLCATHRNVRATHRVRLSEGVGWLNLCWVCADKALRAVQDAEVERITVGD